MIWASISVGWLCGNAPTDSFRGLDRREPRLVMAYCDGHPLWVSAYAYSFLRLPDSFFHQIFSFHRMVKTAIMVKELDSTFTRIYSLTGW